MDQEFVPPHCHDKSRVVTRQCLCHTLIFPLRGLIKNQKHDRVVQACLDNVPIFQMFTGLCMRSFRAPRARAAESSTVLG